MFQVVDRNEVMLEESRNTVTVPSMFVFRILAYLHRRRRSEISIILGAIIIIMLFTYFISATRPRSRGGVRLIHVNHDAVLNVRLHFHEYCIINMLLL